MLLFIFLCRVKKLKETLVAVQQLDKNMSSLRSWLAHIESELSKPIVYETCNSEEIQRKLNEQQVKYNKLVRCTMTWGESKLGVSLGCSYLANAERAWGKEVVNIKASGTYCVTYRAFCCLWHRIHQDLIDLSGKGKAPRDVTWLSYCNYFSFGDCGFLFVWIICSHRQNWHLLDLANFAHAWKNDYFFSDLSN